jgi:putative ABC transport system permease protein
LNGVPYTVIGRIRKKDQDSDYNGRDNDKVFIPFSAMARDFPRPDMPDGVLSEIIVAPHEDVVAQLPGILNGRTGRIEDIDWPLEREIRRILARQHGFDPADRDAVRVWDTSLESIMFERMIQTMTQFFSIVGLVTLSLGGLGVMNIMLVAVRERTREIGIRKALGATTAQIQRQFFLEGFVLTLLSGTVGFLVGFALCTLVNLAPMPTRFQGMILTWQAGAGAIFALVLVGVVTSTYPARRAAQLPPVEALRFES